MRRAIAAVFFLSLFCTVSYADQPITVSGCVIKGVEPGCFVLLTTPGHKRYNISAAQPTPTPDTYGTVRGILRTHWMSHCQQGEVIDPAAWTMRGKLCPLARRRSR